jgi:hypothetical protein
MKECEVPFVDADPKRDLASDLVAALESSARQSRFSSRRQTQLDFD